MCPDIFSMVCVRDAEAGTDSLLYVAPSRGSVSTGRRFFFHHARHFPALVVSRWKWHSNACFPSMDLHTHNTEHRKIHGPWPSEEEVSYWGRDWHWLHAKKKIRRKIKRNARWTRNPKTGIYTTSSHLMKPQPCLKSEKQLEEFRFKTVLGGEVRSRVTFDPRRLFYFEMELGRIWACCCKSSVLFSRVLYWWCFVFRSWWWLELTVILSWTENERMEIKHEFIFSFFFSLSEGCFCLFSFFSETFPLTKSWIVFLI